MPSNVIGYLSFVVLFSLMLIGVPIGFALLVVGVIGLLVTTGPGPTLNLMGSTPFASTASWGFVTLPMFLIMGSFALYSGIGDDAYRAAHAWLGRVRGGLAITTTAACALFGFVSGSSVATSAMFTRIAFPEMVSRGYSKKLAAGTIAAGGTLASLIPPSALMVMYCMFAENVSLGRVLIAGIFPGFLTAAIFCCVIYIWTKVRPQAAPLASGPPVPLREKLYTLRWLIWLLVVMAFILGGIYFGVFTPTEAGALGAFATFVIMLIRKGLLTSKVREALIDAVSTTAMIFLIVVGAMIFSRFLAVTNIVFQFANFMVALPVAPHVIIIGFLFVYLILGTFMDAIGMLALTLPIFLPATQKLGIDPIWFALLVIMMLEIGLLTPPLAMNVFAVKGAAGDQVTLEEVYQGIAPLFFGYLFTVAVLMIFPSIITWLPKQMMG